MPAPACRTGKLWHDDGSVALPFFIPQKVPVIPRTVRSPFPFLRAGAPLALALVLAAPARAQEEAGTPGGTGGGATSAPGEAGGPTDTPSEPLNAVILPSLASILCLAESVKGAPLVQEEVETLVEQAPSMSSRSKVRALA